MPFFDADPVEHLMVGDTVLAPDDAALPAAVPGVLRGEGIFEAFRVNEALDSPFLPGHDQRLFHSARLLDMDLQGRGVLSEWPRFRAALPPGPWRVRYTILLAGSSGELLRFWSAGRPAPAPPEIALAVAPFRRDPADPIASAKTISRASWQVARRRAREAGAWDAILTTLDGHLSECTTSNLFLWSDGELLTPARECGILAGITRGVLLGACAEKGIPAREAGIPEQALQSAEEIFVTSAVLGVLPVSKIVGIREGLPGASGPHLARLREAYRGRLRQAERIPRTEPPQPNEAPCSSL